MQRGGLTSSVSAGRSSGLYLAVLCSFEARIITETIKLSQPSSLDELLKKHKRQTYGLLRERLAEDAGSFLSLVMTRRNVHSSSEVFLSPLSFQRKQTGLTGRGEGALWAMGLVVVFRRGGVMLKQRWADLL